MFSRWIVYMACWCSALEARKSNFVCKRGHHVIEGGLDGVEFLVLEYFLEIEKAH